MTNQAVEELQEQVSEFASRPGHEKVRVLLHQFLVGELGANSAEIDFEKPVREVHGRIDALLGRTVFELKSDLRRERGDAEEALSRYLTDRERQTSERFVGIATDGADLVAFLLKDGSVVEVGRHHTDPNRPRDLLAWLESTVAVGDGLPPEPEAIAREFGRESLAARRALDELETLWGRLGDTPEARLKRELWSRLLSLAYGAQVGEDALFLQHTYLVVVAKAMAWSAMMEAPPGDAAALLHGTSFADQGIGGQSESDFFDWVLNADEGAKLIMQVWRQVDRFRLRDIEADVLKALYENLIDPDTRHDLGEYYTPDWLAGRIVAASVERPLEQRVMDPACGSGTFLFHAVRAVLSAAEDAGFNPSQAVRRAVEKVAGIDVHPVAVIFARVTYLLALLPTLNEEHPGNISLPVYLGDSLQWNRVRVAEEAKQAELLANDDYLEVSVPAVETTGAIPRPLEAATLRFPAVVAADAQLFDRTLNTMIDLGSRSEPVENFAAWMRRETDTSEGDWAVLEETYETMRRLQNEERNHIWGYVARNLARPVWLSSEAQKADVVIGNPPWVSSRYMEGSYQERFRTECEAAGLWIGGNVATQQDLSGYFYMRAASLYMRRTGRIAMVLPYAAMSRQAYGAFRKGEVASFGNVEMWLRFTEAWTFPEVQPLFPVPSCVLFARVHDGLGPATLPPRVAAFGGELPGRNATEGEAGSCLSKEDRPWPEEAGQEKESPYRKVFRNGATLFPRRLVLVETVTRAGRLPPNPEFPLIRGRTGNQDKGRWKDLEPPQGTVEKQFLRKVLLGECIAPFRVLKALLGVIPWDGSRSELMDAETAGEEGLARLARWLETAEELWEKHKRGGGSYARQIDYYGKLTSQFAIGEVRVVYTKSGTRLAAAVVEDENAVVDHTLYWASVESAEEARYLCAVLNSEALCKQVRGFQARGQWGPRHFDKYVFNVPIPAFDGSNDLHRKLAEEAKQAEEVAEAVETREGEYFRQTRTRVRDALRKHGIAGKLERLAGNLLQVEYYGENEGLVPNPVPPPKPSPRPKFQS